MSQEDTVRAQSGAADAVARWKSAGAALEAVRREELRRLTDAEALKIIDDLLDLLRFLPPPCNETSGLVQQQRIFARLRG